MQAKLLNIFKANSLLHLFIIFIVYGITGSLSVFVSEPILNFIKLDQLISFVPLYWVLRIIVIIIAYQILLLVIGTIFGQFNYFKKIQLKFLKRVRIIKWNIRSESLYSNIITKKPLHGYCASSINALRFYSLWKFFSFNIFKGWYRFCKLKIWFGYNSWVNNSHFLG